MQLDVRGTSLAIDAGLLEKIPLPFLRKANLVALRSRKCNLWAGCVILLHHPQNDKWVSLQAKHPCCDDKGHEVPSIVKGRPIHHFRMTCASSGISARPRLHFEPCMGLRCRNCPQSDLCHSSGIRIWGQVLQCLHEDSVCWWGGTSSTLSIEKTSVWLTMALQTLTAAMRHSYIWSQLSEGIVRLSVTCLAAGSVIQWL